MLALAYFYIYTHSCKYARTYTYMNCCSSKCAPMKRRDYKVRNVIKILISGISETLQKFSFRPYNLTNFYMTHCSITKCFIWLLRMKIHVHDIHLLTYSLKKRTEIFILLIFNVIFIIIFWNYIRNITIWQV